MNFKKIILILILVIKSVSLFCADQMMPRSAMNHFLFESQILFNSLNIRDKIQVEEWLNLRVINSGKIIKSCNTNIANIKFDINAYKINPCINIEPQMSRNALLIVKQIESMGIKLYEYELFLKRKKFTGANLSYSQFFIFAYECFWQLQAFYIELHFLARNFRISYEHFCFPSKENQNQLLSSL